MADLEFTPVATGPRTATAAVNLRTVVALTTSYVTSTNTVSTVGWKYVHLGLAYNDGDEGLVQIIPQVYDGTDWRDLTKRDPATGVITPELITLAPAAYADAGENLALPPLCVQGFQKFRTKQKVDAGSSIGTLGVTATGSIDIGARSA